MLAFDIETGPLSLDVLKERLPPFDASQVKLGQLKDKAKIAEKIAKARAEHEEATIGRAALSALTGHIIAVGYYSSQEAIYEYDAADTPEQEADVCRGFWQRYKRCIQIGARMVGHNVHSFDVPFLARRSWLCGVSFPAGVLAQGKWISDTFVDTLRLWQFGTYKSDFVKLDVLARALGVGSKTEGVHGGMFAELWQTDRPLALEYLRNDVMITYAVAAKMGVR